MHNDVRTCGPTTHPSVRPSIAVTAVATLSPGFLAALRRALQRREQRGHAGRPGLLQRLSQWNQYKPGDPKGNLAASWHSSGFNACSTASCWNSQIARSS